MAFFNRNPFTSGGGASADSSVKLGVAWLSGLLGGREIEKRVNENFPTWQEYSEQKVLDAQEREEEAKRIDLPPHKVYISSPLQGNFIYFTTVTVALALGYYSPLLAPVLVYGAIGMVLIISLFVVFRDALFFHIEGLRLELDSDMINRHTRGPQEERDARGMGFLRVLSRRQKHRSIFRSRLLQIHYQNVLRTFEQGNRRTWVDQDASIAEIQTLLSQRGMKLVWTMIEVLPQLGLLGTLIGLMRMFLAFRANVVAPELEIIAGFGTALGTTVVANILVLILRPLYMRNERSMNEILSTMQTLMAMFILPTQQSVLERTLLTGHGRSAMPLSPSAPAPASGINENRLHATLNDLTQALTEFTEFQQHVDSGAMAKETAQIALQVKDTLRAFHDAVDRKHLDRQQQAIEQLTGAVQGLATNLNHVKQLPGSASAGSSERIEHDLMQLRVLTHDTLLLLEQLASRMGPLPASKGRLLSTDRSVRAQVFPSDAASGLTHLDEERKEEAGDSPVRLFKERG